MCVAQSKLVIEKGEEDTNLNRLKKKIHRVAEKKKKKRLARQKLVDTEKDLLRPLKECVCIM